METVYFRKQNKKTSRHLKIQSISYNKIFLKNEIKI